MTQNQIEELFYRLGRLILALKEDSKTWSGEKIQQTATQVEDLMKRCHRQMQRFAIYGRVKAFINRKELSACIESFMLEINRDYKSFSVSPSYPALLLLPFVGRRRSEVMVIDVLRADVRA